MLIQAAADANAKQVTCPNVCFGWDHHTLVVFCILRFLAGKGRCSRLPGEFTSDLVI